MATVILAIVYIVFISNALPSSILGSAWPVMQSDLAVPLYGASIISAIFYGGMIVSSFFNGKLISRFGSGSISFVSLITTSASLLGYWALPSFVWLCVVTIPLGLGMGAVSTTLNYHVAVHYNSRHMNWLHCFWGVGATLGPIIMSLFIAENNAWRSGYLTIALIQLCVSVILFFSLPLWSKRARTDNSISVKRRKESCKLFNTRGIKIVLLPFFCYCSLEASVGLWGSSYLTAYKNVPADIAARWLSLFFIGLTAGRFVSGFAAVKFKNSILIRLGLATAFAGSIILIFPLPADFSKIGLLLMGLGCAPIMPCMIQETPARFGKEESQSIIGIQLAFAFIGSTVMPPVLGLLASMYSIIIFPFFTISYILIMVFGTEATNKLFINVPSKAQAKAL